jgi:hypothetical protein
VSIKRTLRFYLDQPTVDKGWDRENSVDVPWCSSDNAPRGSGNISESEAVNENDIEKLIDMFSAVMRKR